LFGAGSTSKNICIVHVEDNTIEFLPATKWYCNHLVPWYALTYHGITTITMFFGHYTFTIYLEQLVLPSNIIPLQ